MEKVAKFQKQPFLVNILWENVKFQNSEVAKAPLLPFWRPCLVLQQLHSLAWCLVKTISAEIFLQIHVRDKPTLLPARSKWLSPTCPPNYIPLFWYFKSKNFRRFGRKKRWMVYHQQPHTKKRFHCCTWSQHKFTFNPFSENPSIFKTLCVWN